MFFVGMKWIKSIWDSVVVGFGSPYGVYGQGNYYGGFNPYGGYRYSDYGYGRL